MKKYSRSLAKYIRRQKALIRRGAIQKDEQNKLIREFIAQVDATHHHT